MFDNRDNKTPSEATPVTDDHLAKAREAADNLAQLYLSALNNYLEATTAERLASVEKHTLHLDFALPFISDSTVSTGDGRRITRSQFLALQEIAKDCGTPFGLILKKAGMEGGTVVSLDLQFDNFKTLSLLQRLPTLKVLDLRLKRNLSDFAPLSHLRELERLNLGGTGLHDVTPLDGLPLLKELEIWNTTVQNLSPLATVPNLESLSIASTKVSDLSPLSQLKSLRNLDLRGCVQLRDLSPLADATALESINLRGCVVTDLAPLVNLTALTSVKAPKAARTSTGMLLEERIQARGGSIVWR